MVEKCEHRWDKINYDEMYLGDFETVEFPATCAKCGATAKEIWIFSCYVDIKDRLIDAEDVDDEGDE